MQSQPSIPHPPPRQLQSKSIQICRNAFAAPHPNNRLHPVSTNRRASIPVEKLPGFFVYNGNPFAAHSSSVTRRTLSMDTPPRQPPIRSPCVLHLLPISPRRSNPSPFPLPHHGHTAPPASRSATHASFSFRTFPAPQLSVAVLAPSPWAYCPASRPFVAHASFIFCPFPCAAQIRHLPHFHIMDTPLRQLFAPQPMSFSSSAHFPAPQLSVALPCLAVAHSPRLHSLLPANLTLQ